MIKLDNVSFKYKDKNVLNNINLEFSKEEINIIIGKNGSGKSTLGLVASNIYNHVDGKILIDDIEITKKTKALDIRKKVGIVFQNPETQIVFNRVYDDISFTLKNHGITEDMDDIIRESLKIVGMEEYIDSDPYELSLGQKQRIAIASVIAIKPEYIIFDEPTSMIDSQGKKDIYNIIKRLKKEKIGIIYITNIADEILLGDNVIVIEDGNIVSNIKTIDTIKNIDSIEKYGIDISFKLRLINNMINLGYDILDFDDNYLIDKIMEKKENEKR